ncbi:hypothetical protein M885DRAFT_562833 [Pelagophyceae sp. CCMP2097]|nr:hypothetical protein M885DRAFT_562833 [Pelagophyceae sp. CCMP2097]
MWAGAEPRGSADPRGAKSAKSLKSAESLLHLRAAVLGPGSVLLDLILEYSGAAWGAAAGATEFGGVCTAFARAQRTALDRCDAALGDLDDGGCSTATRPPRAGCGDCARREGGCACSVLPLWVCMLCGNVAHAPFVCQSGACRFAPGAFRRDTRAQRAKRCAAQRAGASWLDCEPMVLRHGYTNARVARRFGAKLVEAYVLRHVDAALAAHGPARHGGKLAAPWDSRGSRRHYCSHSAAFHTN